MGSQKQATIAFGHLKGQEIFVRYEVAASEWKFEHVEWLGAELLHVRDHLIELYLDNQSAVARYLFVLDNFRLLSCEMRFEVGPDLQKFLGFAPFLDVFVAIMLALALDDPFGQVEVLPVDLELTYAYDTLRR